MRRSRRSGRLEAQDRPLAPPSDPCQYSIGVNGHRVPYQFEHGKVLNAIGIRHGRPQMNTSLTSELEYPGRLVLSVGQVSNQPARVDAIGRLSLGADRPVS